MKWPGLMTSAAAKPDDTFLMLLKTVVPSGYGLVLAGLLTAAMVWIVYFFA